MPSTVPHSTTIADVDESVRALLKRELANSGLDVAVEFDVPNREWAAALSAPTVNVYLYDLRQATEHRPVEWDVETTNGQTRERRPPLMLDASYAVSAWARAVEDEHRLLSQIVAILNAYPHLPEEVLGGSLVNQPYPVTTKVAQPKSDGKADFWSSIGGTYKASIDYSVTVAIESGMTVERGPQVRGQTVRVRQIDGAKRNVIELHRVGGTVRDAGGEPVAGAWVILPRGGRWAGADAEGRFSFERLAAGNYECVARAPDGRTGSSELIAPGSGVDVTLGTLLPQAKGRRLRKTP